MIIHTGLRTDIPAFYSKWLLNRVKAGKVCVRNPYNESQITEYELSPDVVDLICFCTKNPNPLMTEESVSLLKPYKQFWFVTITPYGKLYEPNVPDKNLVIEGFRGLSLLHGKSNVQWRYDPIFIHEKYTIEQHKISFENICRKLEGYTDTCIISFIDLYKKVLKNFPEVREVSKEEKIEIARSFVETGRNYGIRIKSCGEGTDLKDFGVDVSGCMTMGVYAKAIGEAIEIPSKAMSIQNRKECCCYLSADIGVYNSCPHFCKYCYANYDRTTVLNNFQRHNPESPLLIGEIKSTDVIHKADQKSWKSGQQELF